MPDDEYAPALDAPSVWTTCPRCGQLTHITAARCPSCGRAAAMPVDPDATQGMDLSLIDPSTGQDRPRAGAAGFRPQHGVQESEREEAARLIAGLASPAAGVPDPPSLFTPVIEPTPGTASLPLPAIGGSDDLSDPADVAGVVPLPETVQLPTGSSPPPPQSPPSSPSPPSPLSSPALPSWAPAATPARAAAAWSSPALTGLRATGRRWLAAASAPRTRPLVVAALAVLAAFIAATAVLVWGQPSRQGATAPASSAPATASLVPVLAAQVTVTASSVQLPDGGITYDPVNLLDGHL